MGSGRPTICTDSNSSSEKGRKFQSLMEKHNALWLWCIVLDGSQPATSGNVFRLLCHGLFPLTSTQSRLNLYSSQELQCFFWKLFCDCHKMHFPKSLTKKKKKMRHNRRDSQWKMEKTITISDKPKGCSWDFGSSLVYLHALKPNPLRPGYQTLPPAGAWGPRANAEQTAQRGAAGRTFPFSWLYMGILSIRITFQSIGTDKHMAIVFYTTFIIWDPHFVPGCKNKR